MVEITRIFYGSPLEVGGTLRLSEQEEHYVYKVLRGREGDRIEVTLLVERPTPEGGEGEVNQ